MVFYYGSLAAYCLKHQSPAGFNGSTLEDCNLGAWQVAYYISIDITGYAGHFVG